jgi:hypothetical protein
MRNFSDKRCTENQNSYSVFSNGVFSENIDVYEIIWKNIAEMGKSRMTIKYDA